MVQVSRFLDIMMSKHYHHDVPRTTLTLEPDVAARLKAEVQRTGLTFKDVVNDVLRRGLAMSQTTTAREEPFRITARASGGLQPPFTSLDKTSEALDMLDEIEAPDVYRRR